MTPERWLRIKELFPTAAELPAARRNDFLDAACADDPALRAELESLLSAHDVESAAVDVPALASLDEPPPEARDRWLGRRVGHYEILSLIGHGGMGGVYRARRVDAEYEKEVAIKLVPGAFGNDHVLQRLRAERQILADLEHPHIARLIDGGATDEGAPYLVMELVEGEPIDRHLSSRQRDAAATLRLFLDVCAAVAYAHRHLVVHRDLKPNNILVTADGTVKLLDFGIAKLIQPAGSEPLAGAPVTFLQALTPAYASPEQIVGRPVTTASDIYSLGVVLHELLTGRSPYRRTWHTAEEAREEVCVTEPARPGAGRDLDAIILRALRKEPEQRYPSVDELAEDIRRHLDGRPVAARGDYFAYRAGRFIRRHRLEVAAAALLTLTLIGATLFSMREARIADQQRARAERHFANVRGLANTLLFEVHDAIRDLSGATKAREKLVGTSLDYLGRLAAEAGDDAALRQELAAAYEKVGDIQGQAYGAATEGEPLAASESYARAIALLEPLVAADPSAFAARGALARTLLRRSRLLLLLEKPAEAAQLSARAVSMSETLVRDRSDVASLGLLADAYAAHAYTADLTGGQNGAGIGYARKAIAILEDVARRTPDDLATIYKLATAYSSLAITLVGKDPSPATLDESLGYYRKAVVLDERLVAADPDNAKYRRGLLLDRFNIAFVLNEQGDARGALESARTAQALLPELSGDAANQQARIDAANLAWPLGRALLALGEVEEARSVFQRAFAEMTRVVETTDTLKVHYLLGISAFGLGEVHAELARQTRPAAPPPLALLREAERWYAIAKPHFERVTSSVTLDSMDMKPVNGANEGLARTRAELSRLEGRFRPQ